MKPETAAYLATAHDHLREARVIVAIPLTRIAARSAYIAAFHAAQALVFERAGKVVKTHSGIRSEFSRIMLGATGTDAALGKVLSKGYGYKDLADYSTGPDRIVTAADAEAMIDDAARFVARVADILAEAPSPGG